MMSDFDYQDEDMVTPGMSIADDAENRLRPQSFEEFQGQTRIKDNLRVYVHAAREREESLDHVLLSGPPGLGKTTLAQIIARQMGVSFLSTSGPAIEKGGDLVGILSELKHGDVFFIDEIHRLRSQYEELLYSAMEDYIVDVRIGSGPGSRTVPLKLEPFTLVGATTREGLLTRPLLDRFPIQLKLEYYSREEMAAILQRAATILGIAIDEDAALEIAGRSRYTPRIANRLLARVRDYAQVAGEDRITLSRAKDSLQRENIDERGLCELDRQILRALVQAGRPIALKTLAAIVGEEPDTIEEVYEPFLLREGYLLKTPRGRIPGPRTTRNGGEFESPSGSDAKPTLFS